MIEKKYKVTLLFCILLAGVAWFINEKVVFVNNYQNQTSDFLLAKLENGCEETIVAVGESDSVVSQYIVSVCNEEHLHRIRVILLDEESERPQKVITTDLVILDELADLSSISFSVNSDSQLVLTLPESVYFPQDQDGDYEILVVYNNKKG